MPRSPKSLPATIAAACLVFVSAGNLHASDGAAAAVQNTFTIENGRIRIGFDPGSGTYDVWDRTATDPSSPAAPILAGMTFSANGWKSSDPGYRHEGRAIALDDMFGPGRELRITSTSTTGQPTLVLKLRIHEGQGFITAGGGMLNTTDEAIQLKEFVPAAGKVFPQLRDFPNLGILEGNGGGRPTRVVHKTPATSMNNILMTFGTENQTRSLVMGGLSYVDFQKSAGIDRPNPDGPFEASVRMHDDVGKRVDPGKSYLAGDLVYIDFLTDNPFESAEHYARAIRDAMGVKINAYTFPSICMWFISVRHFGGDAGSVNDTPGAVREMDHVVDSGFLKYSPVAVRIVPDNYEANNQQGWWDDEHWRMYGRKERCVVEGGHYK